MTNKRISIGSPAAVALYDSGWWFNRPHLELAMFQMFTEELSMPFAVFQCALEKAIKRPVWTHELGLNWDGLATELLNGRPCPAMTDITDLLPEDGKAILAIHYKAITP